MRKLVGLFTAVGMLAIAPEARAVSIVPVDFDVWVALSGGTSVYAPLLSDVFTTASPPPTTMGSVDNYVLLNEAGTEYAYVHVVTPSINNISEFNTEFSVLGFTGTAGWKYGPGAQSSFDAGGAGVADFTIKQEDGGLDWETEYVEGGTSGFDSRESILFYYVSTKPPALGDYNLINSEVGTATSYAPVPEPGSMALLGSGLVGLVGAVRRRRRQNS